MHCVLQESHPILCYGNRIMCKLIHVSQEGDKLTFEQYCLWNVYFITPEKPLMGEHSLNLLACWGPTLCKVYYTFTLYCTYVIIKSVSQVIDSFCFFSLQMHCKFTIYNVPWEKRKELLNHECVGLKEERMLSCERSKPAVKTSEPADEDNFVTEYGEEVQLWLTCNWVSLF